MALPCVELLIGGEHELGPSWTSAGPYWSTHHCLYQVVDGEARLAIDGRWNLLRPGWIHLIPGFHLHQRRGSRLRLRWVHLRCMPRSLDLRFAALGGVRSWRLAERPHWASAMAEAVRLRTPEDNLDDPRLLLLIAAAAQATGEALAGLPAAPALRPELRDALACIEREFRNRPPLALVAREAGVSPPHLHRLFRAGLGTTPARCLEDRRMEEAQRLLTGSDLTVAAIATACGYDDPFHFSRVVRRRLGAAPRALRTQR